MNIVCFGEALIDFKAQGELLFQGFVGGSPLNVAVAAARLGAKAALAAGVSYDLFGEAIVAHLEANGVDTSLVERSDAPSTLAFVAESGGDVDFTFIGEGAADTRYDPQPRPTLPPEVAFLEFGSISLLREPGASAIDELIAAHRGRCAVIFDPNVRPALIPDRAAYTPKLERALSLSHLVKVSAQDLRWLYPDVPIEAAAASWLDRGPEAVIVTSGAEGVRLLRREQPTLTLATPRVEVADTVGAGDTFMGALMVRLIELGATGGFAALEAPRWRDALRFAAAAAALNCTRAGANPPTRGELEAFLAQRG
ncbi:carbohydrate kinase family protein [Truepera radiovictrix]|nr:carbohydrate kinase [Truepera radiovictrix]WMT57535.1 carbohydrate kinase [Truepera radiovictrix]